MLPITLRTPQIFIAYAPRAGLRCAVAYLASEKDVYGWFVGSANGRLESSYFLLEDYYAPGETRYVAVAEGDLHSDWTRDEARCHELAALQDAFVHEWLFYKADPGAAAQLEEYARGELAAGDGAIRFERLHRLSKLQPNWTFYSPGFEDGVLECLARHWPLDYRSIPKVPRPAESESGNVALPSARPG
ncbi:MAG TPA: hypothetical protein VII36_05470 [Usitatibacter sp.]